MEPDECGSTGTGNACTANEEDTIGEITCTTVPGVGGDLKWKLVIAHQISVIDGQQGYFSSNNQLNPDETFVKKMVKLGQVTDGSAEYTSMLAEASPRSFAIDAMSSYGLPVLDRVEVV